MTRPALKVRPSKLFEAESLSARDTAVRWPAAAGKRHEVNQRRSIRQVEGTTSARPPPSVRRATTVPAALRQPDTSRTEPRRQWTAVPVPHVTDSHASSGPTAQWLSRIATPARERLYTSLPANRDAIRDPQALQAGAKLRVAPVVRIDHHAAIEAASRIARTWATRCATSRETGASPECRPPPGAVHRRSTTRERRGRRPMAMCARLRSTHSTRPPGNCRSSRAHHSTAAARRPSASPASETRCHRSRESRCARAPWSAGAPHPCRVPRGMRDEMLERLILARITQPPMHRLHGLSLAVVEEAVDVLTRGLSLRPSTEARAEASRYWPSRRSSARAGPVVTRAAYRPRAKYKRDFSMRNDYAESI